MKVLGSNGLHSVSIEFERIRCKGTPLGAL